MYIFYDTETSGLERDFSQVLQIALVFTDDNLNILSSKKIDCRRSPWVVPSPGALLTTGFTPDDLKNSKNSSFEMMQEIDQWARSQYWPVIFAGYNSIGYDEDVLAQNFHMNLLDPGLTTAKNPSNGEHNSCFDVMTAVQTIQAYSPGALKLDIMNEAKDPQPSVKLSLVAQQNGVSLSSEDAHDAMNDIKATVGVAKVCKKVAPQIWDHLHTITTREGVENFVAKNKVFTHTTYSFGKKKPVVATAVATREGSGMTEIFFDLSLDPAPYMAMTAEQLKDVLINQDKKPAKGAPQPAQPFRLVRKNSMPIIMPMDMSDPVLPKGFDEKLAEARADAIKANSGFQKNLAEAAKLAKQAKNAALTAKTHTQQPEEQIDAEVPAAIRPKLDQWMKEFRESASWKDAAALVTDFYTRFEKELEDEPSIRRFVKFAGRIVFEHAPEELSTQKQDQMNAYIAAHILTPDTDVPWMTIAKARKELDKIQAERDEGKKKWDEVTDTQVRSLKLYYTALEKEYTPYLKPASNDNKNTPASVDPTIAPPAPPAGPDPKKAANDGFKP
ncbi:MAG: exonuclease domain-containing protein [Alphaproteobacteria bacterium]